MMYGQKNIKLFKKRADKATPFTVHEFRGNILW